MFLCCRIGAFDLHAPLFEELEKSLGFKYLAASVDSEEEEGSEWEHLTAMIDEDLPDLPEFSQVGSSLLAHL